jgi:phosphatidylglycerol:prolipoprotein diacylglycerol transferase
MTIDPFAIHIPFCLGIPGWFCIREITGYGLMMMVAFLMAGWAIQLDLRARGLDEDYAADIIIAGVIGGLVGAKLWYVFLTGKPETLLERGGFVWYGGFLGATAGILLNGWRRRVPSRFTAEICAAPLALGYALGRVGCFLVNDDYGIPTSLPWGMKFPNGLPPTTVANLQAMGVHFPPNTDTGMYVAVHPTQIYETIAMLLVFWWLWRRRDHGHAIGWLFAWYLVLAGAERFLVELVRAKDDRRLGMFTLAQATSVLLVLIGAALLYKWREPAGPQPLPDSLRPKEVALRGST